MAEIVKKKLWPKFLSLFLAIMMITGTVVYGSWAASAPVGVVKIASLATAGEDGIEIDELEGAELNQAIEEVSESENIRAAGRFLDKKGVRLSFAKVVASDYNFEFEGKVTSARMVCTTFNGTSKSKWLLINQEIGEKTDTNFAKITYLGNGKEEIKAYKVADGKAMEADSATVNRVTGDVLYTAIDGSQRSFNIQDNQGAKAQGLMQAQAATSASCSQCKYWCNKIYEAGLGVNTGIMAAIICGPAIGLCFLTVTVIYGYILSTGTRPNCTTVCKALKYC